MSSPAAGQAPGTCCRVAAGPGSSAVPRPLWALVTGALGGHVDAPTATGMHPQSPEGLGSSFHKGAGGGGASPGRGGAGATHTRGLPPRAVARGGGRTNDLAPCCGPSATPPSAPGGGHTKLCVSPFTRRPRDSSCVCESLSFWQEISMSTWFPSIKGQSEQR